MKNLCFRLWAGLLTLTAGIMVSGLAGMIPVNASTGVGITPGIIRVDKPLMPGGAYKLTPLLVINNGSSTSSYELTVTQMSDQVESRPGEGYISFNPQTFDLEPGTSQTVELKINLPIKVETGNYLAYLEAHPVSRTTGGTSVGVAAATKLYFTVKPANTFMGTLYFIGNFFKRNAPVSYIIPGTLLLGLLVFFLSRKVQFQFRMIKK